MGDDALERHNVSDGLRRLARLIVRAELAKRAEASRLVERRTVTRHIRGDTQRDDA